MFASFAGSQGRLVGRQLTAADVRDRGAQVGLRSKHDTTRQSSGLVAIAAASGWLAGPSCPSRQTGDRQGVVTNSFSVWALCGSVAEDYCSFAYSALAWFRMGMSGFSAL